jgi:hypothetical protein
MLQSRWNSSAKIAWIVFSRSSCFLLTGLAAMVAGLWPLPAVAQGGHLPPDVSGLLLADASVCWSFQKSIHTAQQLAEELDHYIEQQLAKGHPSPVSIDRSGRQPVLAVRVFAHIDYAKPVPCPAPPANASVANNLKQLAVLPHEGPVRTRPNRKHRPWRKGGTAVNGSWTSPAAFRPPTVTAH